MAISIQGIRVFHGLYIVNIFSLKNELWKITYYQVLGCFPKGWKKFIIHSWGLDSNEFIVRKESGP